MGREIRRVPANWRHPRRNGEAWSEFPNLRVDREPGGIFLPQREVKKPYVEMLREYLADYEAWEKGTHPRRTAKYANESYSEYAGPPPNPEHYMPYWPEAEKTHFQMYEDTSEGTPISPVFATPEEVARWCVDNKASLFGNSHTADYDTWLHIASAKGAASGFVFGPENGPYVANLGVVTGKK